MKFFGIELPPGVDAKQGDTNTDTVVLRYACRRITLPMLAVVMEPKVLRWSADVLVEAAEADPTA